MPGDTARQPTVNNTSPLLMDCSKASRELGIAEWRPASETLVETIAGARARGLL